MDIKTPAEMEEYIKILKYLVVFPDKQTKFYKSLRDIAEDISIDYTTISRKLGEENPTICVSKLNNFVFLVRRM